MDSILAQFRDDLASYVRQEKTGQGRNWVLLSSSVKDYWREESRPLLEFMMRQGVMIKTPAGVIKLEDMME